MFRSVAFDVSVESDDVTSAASDFTKHPVDDATSDDQVTTPAVESDHDVTTPAIELGQIKECCIFDLTKSPSHDMLKSRSPLSEILYPPLCK